MTSAEAIEIDAPNDFNEDGLYNERPLSKHIQKKVDSLFYIVRSLKSYLTCSKLPYDQFTSRYNKAFLQCFTFILLVRLPTICMAVYKIIPQSLEFDDESYMADLIGANNALSPSEEFGKALSKVTREQVSIMQRVFLTTLLHCSLIGIAMSNMLKIQMKPGQLLLLMLPKIHMITYHLLGLDGIQYITARYLLIWALSVPYIIYCYSSALLRVSMFRQAAFILLCFNLYGNTGTQTVRSVMEPRFPTTRL